jgi:hypothetical protein
MRLTHPLPGQKSEVAEPRTHGRLDVRVFEEVKIPETGIGIVLTRMRAVKDLDDTWLSVLVKPLPPAVERSLRDKVENTEDENESEDPIEVGFASEIEIEFDVLGARLASESEYDNETYVKLSEAIGDCEDFVFAEVGRVTSASRLRVSGVICNEAPRRV